MWLFTKQGHVSIGQHAYDHNLLVIHAQLREDIDGFVAVLDEVGGQKHEVVETVEGEYKLTVTAQRGVVAEVVARMVSEISYGKLHHLFQVDFGAKPGFILMVNKTGLQVAAVRE